ncbi:hypothetical protein ACJ73_06920 [Blastomyces percursus]|uniref:Uncharacterized protein n=1 Tax=Blastomyces percursus TaxID=1658174 RepID=A0A1J9QNF9_9EURO|nr:hypothetical protein ACJ73_06920 [Blastomyces percursus]
MQAPVSEWHVLQNETPRPCSSYLIDERGPETVIIANPQRVEVRARPHSEKGEARFGWRTAWDLILLRRKDVEILVGSSRPRHMDFTQYIAEVDEEIERPVYFTSNECLALGSSLPVHSIGR